MKTRLALAVMLLVLSSAARGQEIPVTGEAPAGLEPFDKLMTDFLQQHHVPGASLAVTRDGKLVYARGFGWADREAHEKVEPTSLFRLASVSKPITSAAIMRLVDLGQLKLMDHPFELLQIEPLAQAKQRPDPRLRQITILELLQHRGGFDRDVSLDPMFQSITFADLCGDHPPALQTDIIRVMEGRTLDFAPGERYAYSNFGYCVLGRIIEKVSGENYEAYVQREILGPLGIRHMQLGHTLLKDRVPGEVHYYTAKPLSGRSVFPDVKGPVAAPYGLWCLEAMDSHGGWLASASDIVRFAAAFDNPRSSGILKPETVRTIFQRPPGAAGLEGNKPGGKPAAVWYGCGWSVRDVGNGKINTWHTGGLDGTSTLLVRRSDGLDWAVLFNQDKDDKGQALADLIDPLVHQAADAVKRWP